MEPRRPVCVRANQPHNEAITTGRNAHYALPPFVRHPLLCSCSLLVCVSSLGRLRDDNIKHTESFCKFLFISCAICVKKNPQNVTVWYNDAHKRGINMISPAMNPGRDVPCMPTKDHQLIIFQHSLSKSVFLLSRQPANSNSNTSFRPGWAETNIINAVVFTRAHWQNAHHFSSLLPSSWESVTSPGIVLAK